MNDFLRNFVMNTIKKMIASDVDEWQVMRYALGWYKDSVITLEDLTEIETLYAEKESQRLAELEAQKEAEQVEEFPTEETIVTEEIPVEGV